MIKSDIKAMLKKLENGKASLSTIRKEEQACGFRFVNVFGEHCEDREIIQDFSNGQYYEVERFEGEITDINSFFYKLEDAE